ncbi:MAG TPA: exodeoxyribonuclease VII large subunit [Chryseosolibacter sp.]|nr:exodeoxyribonuclease VII large subunit [Chryseosolibacter sp.]
MPEIVEDKRIFSLLEVTSSIQKTLALRYRTSFWVKAEMNKLNHYPHSGHCYPDLVEKLDGKVIAQLKSTLWKDDFIRINQNFLNLVKSPLKDGITILFCAKITFDPLHGLALRIVEIDPVFSLGELEREKQESIARLKNDGIFNKNRTLPFPLLPKRMAIISVQTSKGYADFLKMIDGNPWGYRFFHVLFPSLLQGDKAVESIGYQLERIRKVAAHFDVVAIIRGGGGEVGLSCFNDYDLSKQVALFPLPVMTGIGHATNETVVEMVAYRNAITPTELADFLLQTFHNFSVPVKKAEEVLAGKAERIIAEERQHLQHAVRYFRSVTDNVLIKSQHDIRQHVRDLFKQSNQSLLRQKQAHSSLAYNLRKVSRSLYNNRKQEIKQLAIMVRKDLATFLKQKENQLTNVVKTVANLHPENVLRRGYTITRVNGKAITRLEEVKPADTLETIVTDGSVFSDVQTIKKSSEL